MGIKQRAQENPIMAAFTTLGALSVTLVGIWQGVALGDRLIMTEAEAQALFADYDLEIVALKDEIGVNAKLIAENKKQQECRWLDDKLDDLDHKIYELERDGADPERLRDKRVQYEKYERRFDAMQCALVLEL